MAPIVRDLRARAAGQKRWGVHFCFSGQHIDLALPFLRYFDIAPDSTLNLMNPGQSLGQLTSRASAQLDEFFSVQKDIGLALVQGDTTTAFVAGLSAFYHRVPVAHVEAGLRTADINEPFPEELNRRLITRLATWHYAPTAAAVTTLADEGVARASILMTGNTGIDSFLWASSKDSLPTAESLRQIRDEKLVLVTAHRRENIGEPLIRITQAIAELAGRFSNIKFVLPVHKNPKVVEIVRTNLSGIKNLLLVEPLEYGDLVWTMKRAVLILSDSGGIQEEAPSLKKPVLVLRADTERPEAVEYGTSIIVGSDKNLIIDTATEFLTEKRTIKIKSESNPYGDGTAALKICDHVLGLL
jgi:UDP-N-acetylglucosamine 2-epimerase (non-hydrolysing)